MLEFLGTPHIDYSEFSDTAKRFVDYVTDQFQCERDYVIATMAVAMSTAIGKKMRLKHGRYSDMGNLWVCLIGKSGVNKSSPSKFVLQPIVDLDNELVENYNRECGKVEEINRRNKIASRSKDYKDSPIPLEPMPMEQAIRLTDTTPEKRNEILANIDGTQLGLLCYFDEITQMFHQLGRYNKSSELQDMLSLFDGTSIKVTRKSERTKIIKEPFYSIFGTIQPDVLHLTFGKEEMMVNGFNHRWLFVWPQDAVIPEDNGDDKPIDYELEDWWKQTVRAAYSHDFNNTHGCLILEPNANRIYRKWKNSTIRQRNDMDESPAQQYDSSIMAKLDIMIFHWIIATHYLCRPYACDIIDKAEMVQALNVMDYFHQSAREVYKKITEGSGMQPAAMAKLSEREVALLQQIDELGKQGKNHVEMASILSVSRQYIEKCLRKRKALSGEMQPAQPCN